MAANAGLGRWAGLPHELLLVVLDLLDLPDRNEQSGGGGGGRPAGQGRLIGALPISTPPSPSALPRPPDLRFACAAVCGAWRETIQQAPQLLVDTRWEEPSRLGGWAGWLAGACKRWAPGAVQAVALHYEGRLDEGVQQLVSHAVLEVLHHCGGELRQLRLHLPACDLFLDPGTTPGAAAALGASSSIAAAPASPQQQQEQQQLVQPAAQQLAAALARCRRLHTLQLVCLRGPRAEVAAAASQLPHLRHLQLGLPPGHCNQLGATWRDHLLPAATFFPRGLRSLTASLAGGALPGLAQLSQLQELDLTCSTLDDFDWEDAGLSRALPQLRTLSVRRTRFHAIPEELATLSTLRQLDLSENELGPSAEAVTALFLLRQLTALNLAGSFGGHWAAVTAHCALGSLPALRELHIEGNRVGLPAGGWAAQLTALSLDWEQAGAPDTGAHRCLPPAPPPGQQSSGSGSSAQHGACTSKGPALRNELGVAAPQPAPLTPQTPPQRAQLQSQWQQPWEESQLAAMAALPLAAATGLRRLGLLEGGICLSPEGVVDVMHMLGGMPHLQALDMHDSRVRWSMDSLRLLAGIASSRPGFQTS